MWIELPVAVDSAQLARSALADDIVIMPGRLYSKAERFRNGFRLTCCQEIDDRYVAALARLGQLAFSALGADPAGTITEGLSVN